MESQMSHHPQSYKWTMQTKSNHNDRYQLDPVEAVQRKLKLDHHHFSLNNHHSTKHIDQERKAHPSMLLRSYANHQQKQTIANSISNNYHEKKSKSQHTANHQKELQMAKEDIEANEKLSELRNRVNQSKENKSAKQLIDPSNLNGNNHQDESPQSNGNDSTTNQCSLFVNDQSPENDKLKRQQTEDKEETSDDSNKDRQGKMATHDNEGINNKRPSDQDKNDTHENSQQDQLLLRHQQNHKDDSVEKSFVPFVRQKNKVNEQSQQSNKTPQLKDMHLHHTANNKRLLNAINQDTPAPMTDIQQYWQNKMILQQNRPDLIDPRFEQEMLARNLLHSQLAANNSVKNIDPAILQQFYANYQSQIANNNNQANTAVINAIGQQLHPSYLSQLELASQQGLALYPGLAGHPNLLQTNPYLKAHQINGITEANALQELEYQRYLAMMYPSLLHRREGENLPINHPLMSPDLAQFPSAHGELLPGMQQYPLAAVNGASSGAIPNGLPPDVAAQLQYSYMMQQAALNGQRNSALHPYVQSNMESELLLELERQRQFSMRNEYADTANDNSNSKASKIDEQLSRLQREEMLWMKKQQQIKEEKIRKQQQRQQLINSNYKQVNKEKKENNSAASNASSPVQRVKIEVADQVNQVNNNIKENADSNWTNTSSKPVKLVTPDVKGSTFTVGEIMGFKESTKNIKNADTESKVNNRSTQFSEEDKPAMKDSKCLLLQYINSTSEHKGSTRKRKAAHHPQSKDGANKKIFYMAKLGLVPCGDEKVIREEFEVKRNKRRLKAMEASLASGRIRNRKLRKRSNHNQKQKLTTNKSKSASNHRKLIVKVDFARRSSPDMTIFPKSSSSSDSDQPTSRSPYMPITEPITPPDASLSNDEQS
ncbi:hypothetical protein TrispH2_001665 [Trichoplax sp. H2]|nr:hypothetical protein TrispH2_001665 [Trichoplax sp. H2]|eukprot:RDD46995.1 hypothetical protein TrispH2_001665 [Trichoplax sp. H2]